MEGGRIGRHAGEADRRGQAGTEACRTGREVGRTGREGGREAARKAGRV